MTDDFPYPDYYVSSYWPARIETAPAVADRFRRYIDSLVSLNGTLARWKVGRKRRLPYEDVRDDLTSLIERDIRRDESGKIEKIGGYSVSAISRDKRQYFGTSGVAGSGYGNPMWNRLNFHTSVTAPPNLQIVSYPLYKAVVLATVACWEPLICSSRPSSLTEIFKVDRFIGEAWISYIPPEMAGSVRPPDIPVVEPTPNGGLLLAAATETFNADNPDHVEAARRIGLATRHLDELLPRVGV